MSLHMQGVVLHGSQLVCEGGLAEGVVSAARMVPGNLGLFDLKSL